MFEKDWIKLIAISKFVNFSKISLFHDIFCLQKCETTKSKPMHKIFIIDIKKKKSIKKLETNQIYNALH